MPLKDKNNLEKIELMGSSGLKYYDDFGEMYLVESELVNCLENDFAKYSNHVIMRFSDAEIVSEEKKAQILKRVNILCKEAGITSKSFVDNNNNSERIELTGRAGMKYHDGLGEVYFVDSEMVAPNLDYDYAIYPGDIVRFSDDTVVSKNVQDKIIKRVTALCRERGITPRLFDKNNHPIL